MLFFIDSWAFLESFAPMYCDITTLPPCARARKKLFAKVSILETRATPATDTSPKKDTIKVSAMLSPATINCSKNMGSRKAIICLFVNLAP